MPSQVAPLLIDRPGVLGLNTQQSSGVQPPGWATIANNMEFDATGTLTSRKGFTAQNSTPAVAGIDQIFEFTPISAAAKIISAEGGRLQEGTTTLTDVTNTVTGSNPSNWQFQNFNGKVVGWQQDLTPIVWDGTGAGFTELAALYGGTEPKGNACLSAYGRVWASDSAGTTLHYSALLDETDWTTGDSGLLDLNSVWGNGQDQIIALAAFNGFLIIFGRNSTLVYGDSAGSSIGVDPVNLYVADFVPNVGCIARDSVQGVGNDLIFLSKTGLMSFSRVIQEKSMPVAELTRNVKYDFLGTINQEDADAIRSTYNPDKGQYVLSCPTVGTSYVFDTKARLEDGTFRITTWSLAPTAWIYTDDNKTYLGNTGGYVGLVGGDDDDGTAYTLSYRSGWLDISGQNPRLMMLKRLEALAFSQAELLVNFNWAFDFNPNLTTRGKTLAAGTGSSEYNIGEYNIAEYGGGLALHSIKIPTKGSGKVIKVGITTTINGASMSLQRLILYFKLGKYV